MENEPPETAAELYETFFLGTVEVTRERIVCTPQPINPAHLKLVLMDYLSETAWESPWDDPDIDEKLRPLALLEAATAYFFEDIVEESQEQNDLESLARAEAALQDGPYSGMFHAVCVKFIAGTSARFCEVDLLAIRNGDTWRTAAGVPMTDQNRRALVPHSLHHVDTRKPRWKA